LKLHGAFLAGPQPEEKYGFVPLDRRRLYLHALVRNIGKAQLHEVVRQP